MAVASGFRSQCGNDDISIAVNHIKLLATPSRQRNLLVGNGGGQPFDFK